MDVNTTHDGAIDDEEIASTPSPTLVWVACYKTSLCLGGMEEGSWFYDQGELVTDPDICRLLGGTPRSFLTDDEARAYAAELETTLPLLIVGWPPKHTSTSQGVLEIHVLSAASLPLGFPETRPHYE